MRRTPGLLSLLAAATLWACSGADANPAPAGSAIRVAVAANFATTLETLAPLFRSETGIALEIVPGATGRLAAQIRSGAPFDLFIAADNQTMAVLARDGHIRADSRAVCAHGQLALYGPKLDPKDGPGVLQRGEFRHLAIANEELAPFGVAALEALDDLGVLEKYRDRLVRGENVGQALTFVDTGAADFALVALGQVAQRNDGHIWPLPESLRTELPIELGIVVRDGTHPRTADLSAFLLGDEAQAIIAAWGYRRARR